MSPARVDPFSDRPVPGGRTFAEVMQETDIDREQDELVRKIAQQEQDRSRTASAAPPAEQPDSKRRRRWDSKQGQSSVTSEWEIETAAAAAAKMSRWDTPTPGRRLGEDATPTPSGARRSRWDDATPTPAGGGVRSRWDESAATPTPGIGRASWDETPARSSGGFSETPTAARRSRWDESPAMTPSMTPTSGITGSFGTPSLFGAGAGPPMPGAPTPSFAPLFPYLPRLLEIPDGRAAMLGAVSTPVGPASALTPEEFMYMKWGKEMDDRNRPLLDEELDEILPRDGYKVMEEPAGYQPIRTPARKYTTTPTPYMGAGFHMQAEDDMGGTATAKIDIPTSLGDDMPDLKPEDYRFFKKLMQGKDENEMSREEFVEVTIMKLLLKVKNGTPPQRKQALRKLTQEARMLGAGPIFDNLLPLLMSPTLEDQERHLLVKVVDRVLYKLDDLVRPYVHKILVVIEPLLIDEDYYARVEGREIISNLAKAAGLATMISTMRPDIDNVDEYVRNTTARAFAVVASALGIPALTPFLKAVCTSRKSWQARHTGVKIIQQISILMGCGVLPHLKVLVETIHRGLEDEQQKVRTIAALAVAALAEASAPYGIEAFDCVLKPLWLGISEHRGKGLAAYLKAIGCIIPLMDAEHAEYYTKEVMTDLIRQFKNPDEEMKKIVLKVVKQCVATEGVERVYVKDTILKPYFRDFWTKRMALERRNCRALVDTTQELAKKVGAAEVVQFIVDDLKDENEAFRRMTMETIDAVIQDLGTADVTPRLEEQLIDGILYAFQEQTSDDSSVMLNGFGNIINALGRRVKPYLAQIGGTIKWRLNNKAAKVRQQAADLISKTASVMMVCEEEALLGHLGVVLAEYLGEEYPEVLGSILGALKAIVNVIGMNRMTPPIKDLLPRLTPILKNRHEKVQENTIDLVGRIADRGAEHVPAREWMRICFDLLDLLKAHKKAIRRATVNTFGYIAKAIGPQDVLVTLMNNLKVQERQLRVCTTVAIGVVAETCAPFSVIPGLMNEYRTPDLNVQHGVLKAMSFLFEYIGEMGRDYVYAVVPLLEDALMERDQVHRQIACNVVKHLSLGVAGLGCEDAVRHLLNFVWPNVFEVSPHVINAVFEAFEASSVALGPTIALQYVVQGLFHPARRVRDVYWKAYNNVYIRYQDAMVPAFPRIPDDAANCYERREMDVCL